MKDELNRFLTEAEMDQIDAIFSRAMKRRKESGEEGGNFMLLKCQEEQYVHDSVRNKEINDENMRQLMNELCQKCREHNCCYLIIKQEEEESLPFPREDDDENLPFPREDDGEDMPFPSENQREADEREEEKIEIRKIFNSGKMAMLFSLVHERRLTLEDAKNISGYDWDDLNDMYEGWKIAQEMD